MKLLEKGLIWVGYIAACFIYFRYKKIKKVINELLPFLVFYKLTGLFFESIIEALFEQIK